MKKLVRKYAGGILLAAAIFVSGAVGTKQADAATTTQLTINEDESGSRVMEVVLSKYDKSTYLKGKDGTKFKDMAKKKCPKELDYKFQNYQGGYKFTFTLNFTSLEDYEEKVRAINKEIGKDSEEEVISLVVGKAPFESGISYQESFDTGDLISWFDKGASDAKYVWYWGISSMFREDKQTLSYAGTEYENSSFWSDNYSISQLETCYIDRLMVYNMAVTGNTVNRTVVFRFLAGLESLTEELKTFIEEGVPEGVTGEWSNLDSYSCDYTVDLGEVKVEELADKMNSLLHAKDCSFAVSSSAYGESLFDTGYTLEEKLNLDSFAGFDGEEKKLPLLIYGYSSELYVSSEGKVTFSDGSTEDISSGFYLGSSLDNVTDYFSVNSDTNIDLDSTVIFSLIPDEAQIRTELALDEDEITRTVTFQYNEVPAKEILEGMCKKIDSKEALKKAKAEVTEKGFSISIKGDDSDIETFTTEGLGFISSEIRYTIDEGMFHLPKEFQYKEKMDASGVIDNPEKVTSVVVLASGAKLEKDSRYDKYEDGKNTYEMKAKDSEVEWRLDGKITTKKAMIITAAIIVVVVVIVIAIIVIVRKKLRK